jgi:outer membrane protein assembly factor BamA
MDKLSMRATMLLGILLSLTFTGPRLSATPSPAIESGQSRIERLDVSGNRRVSDTVIRSYIQSKQGKVYSEAQLESDVKELYKSDLFENVEIQEADGDVGKIVTFIVTEKPLIVTVEYIGNQSFTESDILAAYKKNKVAAPVADALYSPQMIKAAERILKDLMTQHGKLQGTVHTEIKPAPPGAVHVRFVLNEDGEAQR